jgi:hypothetical protein
MSTLQILMPVVWTIVSTVVGLALYRTSEAIVQVRSARVAGSAAIALLAFYGLYRATPTSLLTNGSGDHVESLRSQVDEAITRKTEAMTDCLSGDREHCRNELAAIEARLSSMQKMLNDVEKRP